MKNFFTLLFISGLLFTTTLNAQTDITPARYQFSNLPKGAYSIDKAYPGANPPASDADVVDNWNDGFITMLNPNLSSLTAGQGAILNSYFQIVDLGGTVGKVLCMKGSESTYAYGDAGDAGFWLGWWNLAFYTDPDLTPSVVSMLPSGVTTETATDAQLQEAEAAATIRLRIVFHIHQNTLSTTSKLFDILGYTYTGNHKQDTDGNIDATPEFKSGDFTSEEFNWETYETEYTYDDTKWIACEYDFVAPENAGAPLRFTFRFGDNAENTTLLIKELSMTLNPTGDPVESEVLTLETDGTTPVFDTIDEVSSLRYYVNNGVVNLMNVEVGADVKVFSLTGQLVQSEKATDSNVELSLNPGMYLVSVANNTVKVLVQ